MSHDQRSGSRQDRVFNSETRRALRHAARLLRMGVLDVLTAIVILSVAAATAILSVPWQLSVAVTVAIALALPIAVTYVMLRVYGLAHSDVLYVGRQAYREAIAEVTALGGTQTASSAFTDADSLENGDTTTIPDESSVTSDDHAQSVATNESAESDTTPENQHQKQTQTP